MGGFKRILLLTCQIALLGFAGFITYKYLLAVKPSVWAEFLFFSNAYKIILGPALAAFFIASSYAIGRFLWVRLGGTVEFPGVGAEFVLLASFGAGLQAIIAWVLLAAGWLPGGFFFLIALIVLVMEIHPTIESLRTILSPPAAVGESFSRKTLTWLLWVLLFFFSIAPFMYGAAPLPPYMDDPAASFKLTLGHSPLGLGLPLYMVYSGIGGSWAANAVGLGLVWLMIIAMLDCSLRLFSSRPAGLLGGILLLCIPYQFLAVSGLSTDIVLAFFLMAAFTALTWFLFDGKIEGLLIAGFLLGIAVSVSTKAVIFIAVFLIYILIAAIAKYRRRIPKLIGVLIGYAVLLAIGGCILTIQNHYLAGNILYPIFNKSEVAFKVPKPPAPTRSVDKPSMAKPIPAEKLNGVDFRSNYGGFAGIGYKLTLSTDGDLMRGPQGLGPFFMAFIPGILLIMITRRHTLQAWTLILLLLLVYLFWAYAAGTISLEVLYAIFPFQALLTGYIIDRLYLLSKLEEKRPLSYIFIILFVPIAMFTFLWICPGYGLNYLTGL